MAKTKISINYDKTDFAEIVDAFAIRFGWSDTIRPTEDDPRLPALPNPESKHAHCLRKILELIENVRQSYSVTTSTNTAQTAAEIAETAKAAQIKARTVIDANEV
jgi:hypothetical protein